ncbi:substrate-binding domain-containing protein [Anaerocolumna sp. MB42-C2]|uniref:substrate-binding domain-containing protein n=1 Tax=Anaerocolumna sp. MB42-C2 TaxID=3070997 RepID=UPI0027E0D9BA|nr:substrate-binding domain-containing protein [Anaerocolumna sp. MB42-C2]WMJ87481.1 substrate-binding domain-containing protein [Anaerocolumna sp. MB42-C2]
MYIRNKYTNMLIRPTTLENYNIYYISKDKISQFWYIINQGISDMASLVGANYIWDAPEERSVEKQIEIITNAANNGANAMLIAALDPVAVSSAIEYAKSLGVKIIYLDTPAAAEGIITLATDDYSAGVTAGENMIVELAVAGYRQGTIGIVSDSIMSTNTRERVNGFRSVLAPNGNYKLLNTQFGPGSASAEIIANSYIANNPDLVGIYGTNEDTTIGVGNAISKSNLPIVGIGFDFPPETQKMIEDGSLKAVMVQNPYTMGYLGMAQTIAALKGFETGPPYINTGVSVRTKNTN